MFAGLAQADGTGFHIWPLGHSSTAEADDSAAPKPQEKTASVIDQALNLIGINYKYGGSAPDGGLDCSGLVKYVFEQSMNMALPHNALAMSRMGQKISRADLQPGDLVFFNTLRRSFSHVGIYIGGGKFVHAPHTGATVQVMDLDNAYWTKRFEGARRLVGLPADPVDPAADSKPDDADDDK